VTLAQITAERDRLRAALEYLADPDSWLGDPHLADAALFGHDSPFELAVAVLAEVRAS
jgi:hypothetical protein